MLAMRSATFLTTVVTPAKIGTHRFASLNSLRMVLSIKKARAWRAVKAPAEKRAQKSPHEAGIQKIQREFDSSNWTVQPMGSQFVGLKPKNLRS